MDRDTQNILDSQKAIKEIVNHHGWKHIRQLFSDKILELQNAFDIETATPTIMLRDLQARKKASTILFDILREIESTNEGFETIKDKENYIVKLD